MAYKRRDGRWCAAHFRPEFLNRLDEIVLFRRLQRSDMATIVEIQLDRLRRLLADRQHRRWNWIAARWIGWQARATTRSMARGR